MAKASNPTTAEILKAIIEEVQKKEQKAKDAYNKVDESTNRYLNACLTHNYYLLSIDAACIAFIISLTINEKIHWFDFLIILSLITWVVSFFFGFMKVTSLIKLMNSFTYYVLGEMNKMKEVSEEHKKIVDKLGEESSKVKKSPLFYFIVGIVFFMVWYFVKLISN